MDIKKTAIKALLASSLLLGTGAAMAEGNSIKDVDFEAITATTESWDNFKNNLYEGKYSQDDIQNLIRMNEQYGDTQIFEAIVQNSQYSDYIDITNSLYSFGEGMSSENLSRALNNFSYDSYIINDMARRAIDSRNSSRFDAIKSSRAGNMLSEENRSFNQDLGSNFIATPSSEGTEVATIKPKAKDGLKA